MAHPLYTVVVIQVGFLMLHFIQVRRVERRLFAARKWASELASCWKNIEGWLQAKELKFPKVPFAVIQRLVAADPVPCVEPNLALVKVMCT